LLLARTDRNGYSWLNERSGVYHAAGDGACSRYDWAEKIIELDPQKEEQVFRRLERASSSEFQVPAERPMISVLNNEKLEKTFGLCLPPWEVGLRMVMEE